MTTRNNEEEIQEKRNSRGFLNFDADEIYCKSLSGQCNVYSLHRVRKSKDEPATCDDWILVVTLSGKLFRFSIDDTDQRSSTNSPKVLCTEFDLRNEFPSHFVDLEVASSCVYQFSDSGQAYLFLACVDNRSHLVDGGRSTAGGGSVSAPGIIFIAKIAPPWKPLSTLAHVVRTLTTSYAPCLITCIPLRRSSEEPVADQVVFVSGTDQSMHGYRIEMTSGNSGGGGGGSGSGSGGPRSGQISTCECFLGEAFTELDTFIRRGKPLPGTILQLDVRYSLADRMTALGFDSGYAMICHANATQNELITGPVERHFDTPISALKFISCPVFDSSVSPPILIGTQMSLLVCPTVGPARLYPNVDDPNWTEMTVCNFARSDQFDCITCAESIFASENGNSVCYILLGTFSGKVLVYTLDNERASATLRRVHSFLSPVMKIQMFGQKYVAVLLTYTILIFEL